MVKMSGRNGLIIVCLALGLLAIDCVFDVLLYWEAHKLRRSFAKQPDYNVTQPGPPHVVKLERAWRGAMAKLKKDIEHGKAWTEINRKTAPVVKAETRHYLPAALTDAQLKWLQRTLRNWSEASREEKEKVRQLLEDTLVEVASEIDKSQEVRKAIREQIGNALRDRVEVKKQQETDSGN